MTPPQQHPIEGVYQARAALDDAASAQSRTDIARQDWPAYGSALMGVLGSLGHFTHVLTEQVDQTDRDRLYRDALRDHPHQALERAVEHLNRLRQVLATAVSDTEQYWWETQHIHDDTTRRPEDPD